MSNDREQIANKANRLRYVGKLATQRTIDKNAKYGDAIRKVAAKMRVDFPDGISIDQYDDMLLWVRAQDKLSRIAAYDPVRRQEDPESPWADISGYGQLGEEKDLPEKEVGLPPGEYEL